MFFRYFVWHYGPGLRSFLAAERNYIDFGWYFFSISELTRSLFAPWHRIAEKKPGNMVPPQYWQALWGNIISSVWGRIEIIWPNRACQYSGVTILPGFF